MKNPIKKVGSYLVAQQIFIVFCCICSPEATHAAAVYIKAGTSEGQGTAFSFGRRCLVVTAAHVIGDTSANIKISTFKGTQVSARTVAINKSLDLALLEMQVASYSKARKLCTLSASPSIEGMSNYTYDPKTYIKSGMGVLAWLERIGSRAGGQSRILLQPRISIESKWLRVRPADRADRLLRGDSGAGAWFAPTAGPPLQIGSIWGSNFQLQTEARGAFLGVLLSLNQDGARIIPSNIVSDFIAESLAPADLSKIEYLPTSLAISRSMRGIPRWAGLSKNNRQTGLLAVEALESFSIEFDLRKNKDRPRGVTVYLQPVTPIQKAHLKYAQFEVTLYLSSDEKILPKRPFQSVLPAKVTCRPRISTDSLSSRNSFYCPMVVGTGNFLRMRIQSKTLSLINLIEVDLTRERER